MSAKELAAAAKAKGNADFSAKNFEAAIKHFTEAISHDPTDHVFYSNRSACYASLEKFEKAYEDGKKCVELKPDWPKGYTRKGLAEYWLQKYDDAAETYKAGLKLSPEDASMKEGLKKAMDAKYDVPGSAPGAGRASAGGMPPGFDPAALATAAAKNPKIAEYMKDKELMSKMSMVMQLGGSNPQMQQQMLMGMMQQDPRLLELYMAMQGIDVSQMDVEAMRREEEEKKSKPAPTPAAPKKEEPKVEEDLRSPETKKADEFKAKGNEFYKKKQFEEALAQYDKAIESQPNDIIYHNNKCAVWIEMGEAYYDKVLETCEDLLSRRYEMNSANPGGASFEKVAKVYVRKSAIFEKRKMFDQAIEMLNKALMEDNSRHSRNHLRELERAKEKSEKDAYLDSSKAEEANERAKEAFKKNDWATAKKEYDEAVARNPTDAKLYSNRAAALTKLMAYPDALRDLDECLKIDPKFVKAYSRKGTAHWFMKEYHKALQAYENGLKIEPTNDECLKGREQVLSKIQETSRSTEVDEEQVRHAMADPEIQQILHDPQVNMFLKEMQTNPKTANERLNKDAKMQEAVSKLMAAGILRMG
eukprot:TRINITY_DN74240_c0_g1_i1.p1 TRINITY_DN74240_c0_g1~~TRINITY_DN74240_c0_g1_i1.p1  ORF type:complete len:588 (+),score=240.48 TRINITY_DN74240_c0_g1_i1:82-1845(+)